MVQRRSLSYRKADAIIIMNPNLYRVVQQGETYAVQSQKTEGVTIPKCNIIIQKLGGQNADRFVGSMLGNLAQCRFYPGDVVAATLRFTTHQFEDRVFQDVLVTDLCKMGS